MVNVDYSKSRAIVKKPGHSLHNRVVFVEWSRTTPDGKTVLVVTDVNDPFEFFEFESSDIILTLSAEERTEKLVVQVLSIALYVILFGAFLAWMVGLT